MSSLPFTIKPFGSHAVLLEWPGLVEMEILADILGFSHYLKSVLKPEDQWEFVPVYHSLTLICHKAEIALEKLTDDLSHWYAQYPKNYVLPTREWELPVCYEAPFALDIEEASAALKITPEDLVERHTTQEYRVFGIGFLPGFMYLGGVPENLRVPRKVQPRLQVIKGAVGLADKQTGIYPQTSPGGWNIIGNCPVPLFNPNTDPPCFISLGDRIRFRSVNRAAYDLHKIEGEVGIYNFKKGRRNAKS